MAIKSWPCFCQGVEKVRNLIFNALTQIAWCLNFVIKIQFVTYVRYDFFLKWSASDWKRINANDLGRYNQHQKYPIEKPKMDWRLQIIFQGRFEIGKLRKRAKVSRHLRTWFINYLGLRFNAYIQIAGC
jgi:hypothetical protein